VSYHYLYFHTLVKVLVRNEIFVISFKCFVFQIIFHVFFHSKYLS